MAQITLYTISRVIWVRSGFWLHRKTRLVSAVIPRCFLSSGNQYEILDPFEWKSPKSHENGPNFALRILIPSLSSLPPLLSHTNFTPHSNSNANGHLKQHYGHMQVQLHLVPKSLCLGAYGSQWEAYGNHLKRMGHRMHTTIHKAKEISAIAFI